MNHALSNLKVRTLTIKYDDVKKVLFLQQIL